MEGLGTTVLFDATANGTVIAVTGGAKACFAPERRTRSRHAPTLLNPLALAVSA